MLATKYISTENRIYFELAVVGDVFGMYINIDSKF